jgi:hypothetical protein
LVQRNWVDKRLATGWMIGVWLSANARIFSIFHSVDKGFWALPVFWGGQRGQSREAGHLHSLLNLRMCWACLLCFRCLRDLVFKYKDKCTILFFQRLIVVIFCFKNILKRLLTLRGVYFCQRDYRKGNQLHAKNLPPGVASYSAGNREQKNPCISGIQKFMTVFTKPASLFRVNSVQFTSSRPVSLIYVLILSSLLLLVPSLPKCGSFYCGASTKMSDALHVRSIWLGLLILLEAPYFVNFSSALYLLRSKFAPSLTLSHPIFFPPCSRWSLKSIYNHRVKIELEWRNNIL